MEEEKAALEAELQTARRETEVAKSEMGEVRQLLEAKDKEMKDTECREQAASHEINAYRKAVRVGAEPLQLEIAAFLRTMGLSDLNLSPTANSISISELFR